FLQPPVVVPLAKPPKVVQTLPEVMQAIQLGLGRPAAQLGPSALLRAFRKRVLVVDNVDSKEAATTAAQIANAFGGCPLIMTGRYADFARSRETGIERLVIRPFSTDEQGLKVLQYHVGREPNDGERDSWLRVVRRVGGIALALKLAAGYLRAGGEPDGFIEDLKRHAVARPVRDANDEFEGTQGQTLFASLSVTLHHLQTAWGADADKMLPAFASLAHAPLDGVGSKLGQALTGLDERAFEVFRDTC